MAATDTAAAINNLYVQQDILLTELLRLREWAVDNGFPIYSQDYPNWIWEPFEVSHYQYVKPYRIQAIEDRLASVESFRNRVQNVNNTFGPPGRLQALEYEVFGGTTNQ